LVLVFRQSGEDVGLLLYPAVILFTGVAIIIGLGVFQRLSADVEAQVESRDKAAEKNGAGRKK